MRPPVRALLLAFILGGTLACADAGGGRRPNILLISVDTLRSDHLGCYGYARETSPNIDRLASQGVLYEQHVSSSSWTLPGHASIFTSLSDSVHGCINTEYALAPGFVTVAERFRESGYATAGFFAGPYLHPAFGLSQGFDHYENCTSYRRALDEGEVEEWAMDAGVMKSSHADITNPTVYESTRRWLEAHRERPFFVFVHFWDVHFDFIPPPPYDTRFDPDYEGGVDGRNFFFDPKINAKLPERDKQHLVALYDGEIAWTDDHIGRLLADLDAWDLGDDTVVALTADHGTEFWEHEGKAHRTTLYDELIRVPLVIRYPGNLPSGARVTAQTRSIDVAPTLLELAGLAPERSWTGASLIGLAQGESPGFDNTALSELYAVGRSLRAVRNEGGKVLHDLRGGQSVWFDLERDPRELRPRIDFDSGRGRELETLFADTVSRLDAEGAARAADPVTPGIDREVLEQLQGFGYVGEVPDED